LLKIISFAKLGELGKLAKTIACIYKTLSHSISSGSIAITGFTLSRPFSVASACASGCGAEYGIPNNPRVNR